MKFYFVNQGSSYKKEKEERFLWAPYVDKRGKQLYHWETMTELEKGDIVFSNFGGKIVSVNVVARKWYESINSFENDLWLKEGRRVDAIYFELSEPIFFKEYKDILLKIQNDDGPFDINGNAKQGYLFRMNSRTGNFLLETADSSYKSKIFNFSNSLIEDDLEDIIEEQEQIEKINNEKVKGYSDEVIKAKEKEPFNYIEEIKLTKNSRVKTDPILKATRLERAKYLCEIDSNHMTFVNSTGEHQYLECHHIIPVKAQKFYPNIKLDSMFNLIAVCPICHSKMHYGNYEAKKEIFKLMYEVRRNELENSNMSEKEMCNIFEKYC